MKSPEQFDPRDPKYKRVADLPEEKQDEFVDVEGGFITKEAADYDAESKKLPPDEEFRKDWEAFIGGNKELSEDLLRLFGEFNRTNKTFLSGFYIQRPEQWELVSDKLEKLKSISGQSAKIIGKNNEDSNIVRLLENIATSIQKYQDEFEKWQKISKDIWGGAEGESWDSFVSAGQQAGDSVDEFNEELYNYKVDNDWLERWGETQRQYHERVLGDNSEK